MSADESVKIEVTERMVAHMGFTLRMTALVQAGEDLKYFSITAHNVLHGVEALEEQTDFLNWCMEDGKIVMFNIELVSNEFTERMEK